MSVQSLPSPQEPSRLGIAFVTALLLHGGTLAALTLWPSKEAITPPGEQEITIDLAPAMEEVVAVAPAEMSAAEAPPVDAQDPAPAEPEIPEEIPPEEVTESQPEEVAALSEPEQAVEAVPIEAEPALEPEAAVTVPPPETVVAKPVEQKPAPKPEKKPPPKPVVRKPAPRRTVAEQKPPPPSLASRGQASASRENSGGAAASADPNVLNRYAASIKSALQNRARYPEAARSQGVSGIATMRFTIDRSGQILNASLVRSAGHPALDQAALTATRPGSSLPPAPASLSQQQLTFSIPLRFDLR